MMRSAMTPSGWPETSTPTERRECGTTSSSIRPCQKQYRIPPLPRASSKCSRPSTLIRQVRVSNRTKAATSGPLRLATARKTGRLMECLATAASLDTAQQPDRHEDHSQCEDQPADPRPPRATRRDSLQVIPHARRSHATRRLSGEEAADEQDDTCRGRKRERGTVERRV